MKKFRGFFFQEIKNSITEAIILFATFYFIRGMTMMFSSNDINPSYMSLLPPFKEVIVGLFIFIFLWMAFCYIKASRNYKAFLKVEKKDNI